MYSEPRRPFHARSEADLLMEAKANPQQQMICQQRANSDWMLSSEKRLKSPSKLSFDFFQYLYYEVSKIKLEKDDILFNSFLQNSCNDFTIFDKVILALEVMSLSMIFRSREGLK